MQMYSPTSDFGPLFCGNNVTVLFCSQAHACSIDVMHLHHDKIITIQQTDFRDII
jgi:hypothetical protein